MFFDGIYGNDEIKRQLTELALSGNISHAIMFYGDDGVGMKQIAKVVASMMIGLENVKEHPDIYEYSWHLDKRSLGVEDIRIIVEEISKRPYLSDKRIVIIDEFDKATDSAQNAFLKTLEEPSKDNTIILIVENFKSILDTIKSRCQVFKFKPLSQDDMKSYLKERYKDADDEELAIISSLSQGMPKKANMLFKDGFFKILREDVFKILNKDRINFDKILNMSNMLEKYKNNFEDFFVCILTYIRDLLIFKENLNKNSLINKDKLHEIEILAYEYNCNELFDLTKKINNAVVNLKSNVNFNLVMEIFMLEVNGGTF